MMSELKMHFYGKHNHSTKMHYFVSRTEQYDVGTKRETLFLWKQNKYDDGAKQMHYFYGKQNNTTTELNMFNFIKNRTIQSRVMQMH